MKQSKADSKHQEEQRDLILAFNENMMVIIYKAYGIFNKNSGTGSGTDRQRQMK